MNNNQCKYVLISGGSGGLGRATVLYFIEKGYKVFSLDIKTNDKPIENLIEIQTDLTDSKSIENALLTVKQTTDSLCAVISLAGIHFMDSMIEISEEDLKRIFDINFFGTYRMNKAFFPLLQKGKGRYIITTSELAGMKAFPFNGTYSLTKTTLQHYADALRQEMALLDIPVIEIMPGAFATTMVSSSFTSLDKLIEKTKLYKTNTHRFRQIMESQTGGAKPPIQLAKVVYKASTCKRPHLRYKPNASFLLKFFNIFPRRLQVFIIKNLIKK